MEACVTGGWRGAFAREDKVGLEDNVGKSVTCTPRKRRLAHATPADTTPSCPPPNPPHARRKP
eukprot:2318765-Rhodomonas_salina.2